MKEIYLYTFAHVYKTANFDTLCDFIDETKTIGNEIDISPSTGSPSQL